MKNKFYLKIIKSKCNKCGALAESVGKFNQHGIVDIVGIDCVCGFKQKIGKPITGCEINMNNKKVKIYTTKSCRYCQLAKAYFKENNIPYEEVNITENKSEIQKVVNKTGFLGVPIIEIDGKYLMGFNKAKINELLGI